MSPARPPKPKPEPGPDDLVRTAAGAYRSGDARFVIQKSDQGWFVIDSQETDELGQQLIHGPFTTLDGVRSAIPGARDVKPLLRLTRPKRRRRADAKPLPVPRSWIDELPSREATSVRRLIGVLEAEGLADAEELARRHRHEPNVVATRLVEQRLKSLIDDLPEADRAAVRQVVSRAIEVLALDGTSVPRPAARWALVAFSADDEPPARRMTPRP